LSHDDATAEHHTLTVLVLDVTGEQGSPTTPSLTLVAVFCRLRGHKSSNVSVFVLRLGIRTLGRKV